MVKIFTLGLLGLCGIFLVLLYNINTHNKTDTLLVQTLHVTQLPFISYSANYKGSSGFFYFQQEIECCSYPLLHTRDFVYER